VNVPKYGEKTVANTVGIIFLSGIVPNSPTLEI
jgi:hypothetical protein